MMLLLVAPALGVALPQFVYLVVLLWTATLLLWRGEREVRETSRFLRDHRRRATRSRNRP
jgi:hypothetical protein